MASRRAGMTACAGCFVSLGADDHIAEVAKREYWLFRNSCRPVTCDEYLRICGRDGNRVQVLTAGIRG
jgi:hypothetical protein